MDHLIVADNGHGFLDFRELYACYNHLLHTVMNSLDLMQQNVLKLNVTIFTTSIYIQSNHRYEA